MILYPYLLKRGLTLTPWLILIPRWAKEDRPYHDHEQVHAGQQRKEGVLVFWWRYLISKQHRLAYEVEAYKAQIKAGASEYGCAVSLATGYNLGLTTGQAAEALRA